MTPISLFQRLISFMVNWQFVELLFYVIVIVLVVVFVLLWIREVSFVYLIQEIDGTVDNNVFLNPLSRLMFVTNRLRNPQFNFLRSAFYVIKENERIVKFNSALYRESSSIMENTRRLSAEREKAINSVNQLEREIDNVLKATFPLLSELLLLKRTDIQSQQIFLIKFYRMRLRAKLRKLKQASRSLMEISCKLYQESSGLRIITCQFYKKDVRIRMASRKFYEDCSYMMIISSQLYSQSILILVVCEVFFCRKWVRSSAVAIWRRIAPSLFNKPQIKPTMEIKVDDRKIRRYPAAKRRWNVRRNLSRAWGVIKFVFTGR